MWPRSLLGLRVDMDCCRECAIWAPLAQVDLAGEAHGECIEGLGLDPVASTSDDGKGTGHDGKGKGRDGKGKGQDGKGKGKGKGRDGKGKGLVEETLRQAQL